MNNDSSAITGSLVSSQMDFDFDYIQRNIRDLSTTAQFQHTSELEELHKLAYKNLKEQMAPDKPLAVDPQLVLEAYKTISAVCMQTIETKRKAAETLLKARSIVSPLLHKTGNGLIDEDDDVFNDEVSEASVTGETGVFGNLMKGDPEM